MVRRSGLRPSITVTVSVEEAFAEVRLTFGVSFQTDIVRFIMVTLKVELLGLVLDAGTLICGLKVGVPA